MHEGIGVLGEGSTIEDRARAGSSFRSSILNASGPDLLSLWMMCANAWLGWLESSRGIPLGDSKKRDMPV